MRKKGFERQGASTFLVYEFEPEDAIDSMSFGMLMNNNIPGFAKTLFTQMDDRRCVRYDVTARVSAAQYLHGTVNRKRMLGVLQGIVNALLSAEEYMIDSSMVSLELDNIFSDVATSDTVLICLPVANGTAAPVDLLAFFKNILFSAQYDESEDRDYVAKIVSYLNASQAFSAEEFKGVLDYLASEAVRPQAAPPRPQTFAGPPPVVLPAREGVPKPPAPALPPVPGQQAGEGISLFYLLQHYNKENAAAYKAQKNAKKAAKTSEKEAQKAEKEAQKAAKRAAKAEKRAGNKAASETPGFSVPGQDGFGGAAPVQIPGASPQPSAPGQAVPPYAAQSSAPGQAIPPYAAQPSAPGQGIPSYAAQPSAPGQAIPPYAAQPSAPGQGIPSYAAQPSAPGQGIPSYAAQPSAPGQAVPPYAAQPGAPGIPSYAAQSDETAYMVSPFENESDETVIIGRENKIIPHLVRKKNSERILILKDVFRIGRDVDYNDYAVSDNRYIGHSHCHILTRDGQYFLVDDNSKNHTMVNGNIVTPGEEVPIAHGCLISVADEEFEFKLF